MSEAIYKVHWDFWNPVFGGHMETGNMYFIGGSRENAFSQFAETPIYKGLKKQPSITDDYFSIEELDEVRLPLDGLKAHPGLRTEIEEKEGGLVVKLSLQ